MINLNIDTFIERFITQRSKSMFITDIEDNIDLIRKRVENKSVMVIGGAGTIGSSFILNILSFKPVKLVVVDTNENGLTELTRVLRSTPGQYVPKEYMTYPINFGTKVFEELMSFHGPFNIVANFAAHKHVRSEKDKFSIKAMMENNVIHSRKLLDSLLRLQPEHFFCVSTDKATNPVNIMGASKKMMEDLILSYATEFKVTTARFANVAFSNGSLLQGYLNRLSYNQPISCPVDVRRFFVSPQESGQICMLACLLGESGDIFFPKLKEKDLVNFRTITDNFFKYIKKEIVLTSSEEDAKVLASKMKKGDPYPIYYFKSDTSGEKLYEEFFDKNDEVDTNQFKSLGIIRNEIDHSRSDMNRSLNTLVDLMNSKDFNKITLVNYLKTQLINFNHIETGVNLDQKM